MFVIRIVLHISVQDLSLSVPVGRASLAADRNAFTEQPVRADVAP